MERIVCDDSAIFSALIDVFIVHLDSLHLDSIYQSCILVNYMNGCPNKAKGCCYLGHGTTVLKQPGLFSFFHFCHFKPKSLFELVSLGYESNTQPPFQQYSFGITIRLPDCALDGMDPISCLSGKVRWYQKSRLHEN